MADTTTKALNLATRLVSAADDLMSAVERLQAIKDSKESSGIDFLDEEFETALAASSIKHVTGDNLNSVLSSGAALKAWLESNFHDDVFQQARP